MWYPRTNGLVQKKDCTYKTAEKGKPGAGKRRAKRVLSPTQYYITIFRIRNPFLAFLPRMSGGVKVNNIAEKLRPYQSFGSAAEMHRAVELHIRQNQLNESALRVLRVLEFRSKLVPGVSWLKYETIAGVIGKSV